MYTPRRTSASSPTSCEVEPGFRVLHVHGGPAAPVAKHELFDLVDPFVDAAEAMLLDASHRSTSCTRTTGCPEPSPTARSTRSTCRWSRRSTRSRASRPTPVSTTIPELRTRIEQEIITCSDLILASTDDERAQLATLYDADPERIEIVPPGVDHTVFEPGDRARARNRLGLDGRRVLLFVGRIQPLKGVDVAVRCLAALDDPQATLVVVGGPSGADGEAELARVHRLVDELGVTEQVRFVPPQPHAGLADFYRAADVCLVPSRTESFGLVALEAAACGTPVVAGAVGGLRSLVDDGHTGFLVEGRDPADFAAPGRALLADPELAAEIGANAVAPGRAATRGAWPPLVCVACTAISPRAALVRCD